jgi:hypothetical protein
MFVFSFCLRPSAVSNKKQNCRGLTHVRIQMHMYDISRYNLTAVRRPPVWKSAANMTGKKLHGVLVAIRNVCILVVQEHELFLMY